jgi:hypothetical protein
VKGKVAYDMDQAADGLVRGGLIPIELLPGIDPAAWTEENRFQQAHRPASLRELLQRRFLRLPGR